MADDAPYRDAAPPAALPPPRPDVVFTVRRYGWAWLLGMAGVALALIAYGLFSWSRTLLLCSHPVPGEWAACSLETRGVFSTKREAVWTFPSGVEAKVIDVGSEGSPHQLGVKLQDLQVRWFQLGEEGNARVAADYRSFLLSGRKERFAAELAHSRSSTILFLLLGALVLPLVLVLESRARFELWREGGRLRVTRRHLLFRTRATTIALAADDGFDVESDGGKGSFQRVVLRRGETRQPLCSSSPGVARSTAGRLARFAKEHGQKAEAAPAPAPEPTAKSKKKRRR